MGSDREPDGWLGSTLRQAPAMLSEACPDAETLAAWADGGLSVKASAAVELHASNCARCTAVLAAMERSAPAVSATHAWTPVRVFRWLAPLTAAATAVAVWIAVSDRPITEVAPAPAHDSAVAQPETQKQHPAPSAQNLEPQPPPRVQSAPSARIEKPAAEQPQPLREEAGRDRAVQEALGATAGAAADAMPRAAAPSPAAPAAVPPPAASSEKRETITATGRLAFNSAAASAESASPSNPLVRWRIVAFASVERSTDGGKTWTKAVALPGAAPNDTPAVTAVAIRAVDGDRAVARTSDSAEFYTTDGGLSWTRVQENSAAPF